jgi:RNA polymerase sigma-70 factor (ECF subfamily)
MSRTEPDPIRRFPRTYRLQAEDTVVSRGQVGEGQVAGAGERTDADLIRSCLAGGGQDRRASSLDAGPADDAFAILVERYQKRAFWIAFHVLGRVEESRDVAQDAFVRVYKNLDRFDFSRSFYTWLYRIVMNLAIDSLRKIQSQKSVAMEEGMDPPAVDGVPSDPIEGAERKRLVHRVIAKLPPRFKTVLILRDIEGMSCKEIVPIMKISHATVRWRLHRARQMFKEHWQRITRDWSE